MALARRYPGRFHATRPATDDHRLAGFRRSGETFLAPQAIAVGSGIYRAALRPVAARGRAPVAGDAGAIEVLLTAPGILDEAGLGNQVDALHGRAPIQRDLWPCLRGSRPGGQAARARRSSRSWVHGRA